MPFSIDFYLLIPLISLIVQTVVLALLFYGYTLFRRKKFLQHGRIMASATVLHLITIFTVMVPSFFVAVLREYILTNTTGTVSLLSLIHVPLGIAAISLAVWFVVSWRLGGIKSCYSRRKFMRATIAIWVSTLILGLALYGVLYWQLLMS